MDNKALLVAGAGGAVAAGLCLWRVTRPGEVYEEDDLFEAELPSLDGLKRLRMHGKTDEEIRRIEAFESLPERSAVVVPKLDGAIERAEDPRLPDRIYAPVVRQRRLGSNYPTPALERDPLERLWAHPTPAETANTARDNTRWTWGMFTRLDAREQLVSTQNEYVSADYGVRVVLIPTLRLADKQFYDSVADEVLARKAFVLTESLHAEVQREAIRRGEEESAKRGPIEADAELMKVLKYRALAGQQRTNVAAVVGGELVTLDYLSDLISQIAYWKCGDFGLTEEEMNNIGINVNHEKTFRALCARREAHLLCLFDECLRAAESDEKWKEHTGQERTGEKVIALPWNGRHGIRLERFLVEHRGFTPLPDKQVHRVMLDPEQVKRMVAKAALEDKQTDATDQDKELCETPLPTILPEEVPPPFNFGEKAAEMRAQDSMRCLRQLSALDGSRQYLNVLVEAGLEMSRDTLAHDKSES